MVKKSKGKGLMVVIVFLSISILVFFSFNFIPTANAIKVSSDFKKNNEDPFDVLEGDLDFVKSNGLKVERGMPENKKDLEEDVKSFFDLNGYEDSLEKIKNNYVEIENELENLERVKRDIEKRNNREIGVEKELNLIKKEIELLKLERTHSDKHFSFYGFLMTLNLIILGFVFLYSRNFKIRKFREK